MGRHFYWGIVRARGLAKEKPRDRGRGGGYLVGAAGEVCTYRLICTFLWTTKCQKWAKINIFMTFRGCGFANARPMKSGELAGRRTRISFNAQVVKRTDSKRVSRRLGGRDRQVTENKRVAASKKWGRWRFGGEIN